MTASADNPGSQVNASLKRRDPGDYPQIDTKSVVEIVHPNFSGAAYRKVCAQIAVHTGATPLNFKEAAGIHEMLFGQQLPEYHPDEDWYGDEPPGISPV